LALRKIVALDASPAARELPMLLIAPTCRIFVTTTAAVVLIATGCSGSYVSPGEGCGTAATTAERWFLTESPKGAYTSSKPNTAWSRILTVGTIALGDDTKVTDPNIGMTIVLDQLPVWEPLQDGCIAYIGSAILTAVDKSEGTAAEINLRQFIWDSGADVIVDEPGQPLVRACPDNLKQFFVRVSSWSAEHVQGSFCFGMREQLLDGTEGPPVKMAGEFTAFDDAQ
jgi:hypothetical protein